MLTYRDAIALRAAERAVRQTAMLRRRSGDRARPARTCRRSSATARGPRRLLRDVRRPVRPRWAVDDRDDDRGRRGWWCIREARPSKLFGGRDPIGRTIRMGERDYVVTGVVDDWKPLPKFYRLLGTGALRRVREPVRPVRHRDRRGDPSTATSAATTTGQRHRLQGLLELGVRVDAVWVELADAADAPAYRDFLAGYVAEQKQARPRSRGPTTTALYDVHGLADVPRKVVLDDSRACRPCSAFGVPAGVPGQHDRPPAREVHRARRARSACAARSAPAAARSSTST